ncbi:ABC transporter permease [Embleya sp. NPDC059259]|uniref:ABC transporter permease n=1 Tax=unclassified Embleya TaxID=2699296 RepID=UPI0036751E8C
MAHIEIETAGTTGPERSEPVAFAPVRPPSVGPGPEPLAPERPMVARAAGSALARDLRTVRVLWQREMIRFARNRVRLAMGLVTPLMFLLILGTGLNSLVGDSSDGLGDYRAYLFPGVLIMAVQAPAIAVGVTIVWDRQAGFLRQMLVAPVRRGVLLTGICLGGAATGAAHGALVLAVAGAAGVPYTPQLLLVLLELALISFAFTALGVLAAVCIRRIETFQVVVGMFMMPLLFLSGAMFPARGLPGWLGGAVLVNPLTYGVDALRRTLPGDVATPGGVATGPQWWGWTPPVLLEVAFLAVAALVALTLATRRFARAE